MSDYAELVKSLRICASEPDCEGCKNHVADEHKEAADAIEELQAAIEGYEATTDVEFVKEDGHERIRFVPKWIPVTERLPDTCAPVLVCIRFGMDDYEITVGEYWGNSKASPGWGIFDQYVTHWMSLPTPPKGGTE